ncbi:MAG: HAD-IA family hydrolase [Verrucomicrobiales bacterium]|nr:HAD-IA family hydrolase [Verrucomicrobiales bacterium]
MSEAVKPLLIFDFDGTLANTIDTGIGIYNEISSDYGLEPFTSEDIVELRKLNIRAVLSRIGISKITAIKIATRIRKEIHDRMDEVEIFPGAAEAVSALHEAGFRMGILSSNSTDNIRDFIKRFNLSHCFEFIEAGVSLFGKSNRINQVLKKQKVAASNVLYIGDETRDMEAARKSEVCAVAVCWGANEKEAMVTEGPEYCIEDPGQLIECARAFARR